MQRTVAAFAVHSAGVYGGWFHTVPVRGCNWYEFKTTCHILGYTGDLSKARNGERLCQQGVRKGDIAGAWRAFDDDLTDAQRGLQVRRHALQDASRAVYCAGLDTYLSAR